MKTHRVFTAATIGKLIEAHLDGDNDKFKIYAEHIAGAYDDEGNHRGAQLIRDRLMGIKPEARVVLDGDLD